MSLPLLPALQFQSGVPANTYGVLLVLWRLTPQI